MTHSEVLPNMTTYSSSFLNNHRKKIFCKYWEPADKARALVFVAHGFAEHCLPYDSLAKTLASNKFFVFSHDHIGHGQSGGSRVHVEKFDHFVDDVLHHVDLMKEKFPNLPIFLLGHSMGGSISILTALKKPDEFKGVLLVGPAVSTNPDVVTPFKIKVSRILRWLLPHFPVGSLDYSTVCSSPQNVKIMNDDPLRFHGYCKAGIAACIVDATLEIREKIPTISFPFLMLQGEQDKICECSGAQFMYQNSISEDKTIKIYPKAYHCLFLEPNGIAEQVTNDILDWLLARS